MDRSDTVKRTVKRMAVALNLEYIPDRFFKRRVNSAKRKMRKMKCSFSGPLEEATFLHEVDIEEELYRMLLDIIKKEIDAIPEGEKPIMISRALDPHNSDHFNILVA